MTSRKKQRNHKIKNNNDAASSGTPPALSSSSSYANSIAQQAAAAATHATGPPPQQQQQSGAVAPKGMFSPGQLAALILLTLGISRLMQVKSALRHEQDGAAKAAAPICLDYIMHNNNNNIIMSSDIVCVDDVFHTWLNFKYMTGLQVLLTTCGMWLRGGCWFHEDLLRAFNAVLVLTPIVTTAVVWLMQLDNNSSNTNDDSNDKALGVGGGVDVLLNPARIWQQAIMCAVLSFVAMPATRSQLPFISNRLSSITKTKASHKTLSSLLLMTLFCMQMLQVLAGLGLVVVGDRTNSANSGATSSAWFPQLPNKTIVRMDSTGGDSSSDDVVAAAAVASAIRIIHSFWLVDMFTLAAVYFFAWFHLSASDQKVRRSDHVKVA
jgi:hypothetical protein